MARLRLAWLCVLVVFVCLVPALALACPACAARGDGTNWRTLGLLASMIFLPFVVAGVVIQVIRRLESDVSR